MVNKSEGVDIVWVHYSPPLPSSSIIIIIIITSSPVIEASIAPNPNPPVLGFTESSRKRATPKKGQDGGEEETLAKGKRWG